MFRIYVADAYWWPVSIAQPSDDGWKSQTLELQYRHFTADAFEAFMSEVRAQQIGDRAIAERVVLNWRNVVTPDGAAVPFSAEALLQVLRTVPGAAACIVRDFIDCHTRAAEKN